MTSNSRGIEENADENEADFGEFGGFEAAEPTVDVAASQAEAGTSPWAVFNAGNAAGRPDLLCAQNRFPTYLDPSDISGVSAEPGILSHSSDVDNGPVQPQADLFGVHFVENQNLLDQARIAENVLDGTLSAATSAGFHSSHNVINGRLPDIGLGFNENHLFTQSENPNIATANSISDTPPLELLQDDVALAGHLNGVAQDAVNREVNAHTGEQEPNTENVELSVHPVDRAENEVNRVTDRALQERMNALIERNHLLEEELSRYQEELASQRSRFQEVQDRHTAELEEVQKAGQNALTVVVEQYKEQSRSVVVEQQEAAQRHLVETLAEQMKAFQDMLKMQQELHESQRDKDGQEVERRIHKAVEEACQKQQEGFDAMLMEEQVKQKETIQKAVEAERVASQERLEKYIEVEQQQLRRTLDELKTEYSKKLDEERRVQETLLATVREEGGRFAQEQISQLVKEERDRGKEAIQTALETARQDTRTYINEQRQADSRARRRHLMSLDIFLESARQQIALLLETEKPDLSSLSPSSSEDARHSGARGDS